MTDSLFSAPIGYRYKKTGSHGKLLTPDEPIASIIKEVLEGYASDRFGSPVEVKRFFEAQPAFPKDRANGWIHPSRVTEILTRVIHTGYIEHEPWGITSRKGHHEALISLATYEKIQTRRASKAIAPKRKDIYHDFPLRGFVNCACCDTPMTAAWSKSRNGTRHPYYFCQTKGCDYGRKSIRRADIEGAFEEQLQALQPSRNLFEIGKAMLKQAWNMRLEQQAGQKADLTKQIKAIDAQITATLGKIMQANSATVIGAFERRVEELESQKLLLSEKQAESARPKRSFAEIIEPALSFFANPWNLYQTESFDVKRLVLKAAF